jgi:hypothetical protein
MSRERKLYFILGVLSGILVILVILAIRSYPELSDVTASPSPIPSPVVEGITLCRSENGLPDHVCTPGAVDRHVTQENIGVTICSKGYTARVRPPVSYTNVLKREQIAKYGYEDQDVRHYEEDHLIPLELGGSPSDPRNLWPEPGESPNAKDTIENICRKKVCSGALALGQAQQQIAADWHTACR